MHTKNANVDAAEIAKFSAMAERWWDRDGEFKPLHDINPIRANYIDGFSPVAGQKLVDVGCGGGILSEAMAQRGAIVTGIDMGEAPLDVARKHAASSSLNIDYIKTTAEDFSEKNAEQFSIVSCLEMLEHVPDPQSVVTACAALTCKNGDLYFSTINRTAKAWGFAVLGAEYLLKLLPKGTHDYEKFIKPSELARFIRHAGLEVLDISGIVYNPLTKRYKLSSTDVSVNYLIHAKKT